ncbi:phosphate propanoyltransferase [Moorella thermoacetica]|uniref:Phosphate propanoyltransferase n=1 Tax=Neomoorella thermoacetica TaxID=1525 RepID=A0A1J5NLK0_NEOTH|nr:phosphate propanoyltransferase [Moorella thermoacetica]
MIKFRDEDFLPVEVPVGVSNRHIHLCRQDLDTLFGPGYELTVYRQLSQPGEYAARETVTIVGPCGVLEGVRVLGPVRSYSQVEIAMTDSFRLGLKPPVRESGDLEGTPGIAVVGPSGALALPRGVILAARHIHMEADRAASLNLHDDQRVQVLVPGLRGMIFNNVIVRVSPHYRLELHLDTDEANAALLASGDKVKILRP